MADPTYSITTRVKQHVAHANGQAFVFPVKKRLYLATGTPTWGDIGMAAPSAPAVAAGSSGVLTGTYIYYTQWVDQNTNCRSPLSTGTSVVLTADQADLGTFGTPPTRATHINIYRTSLLSDFVFLVKTITVATTSTSDNVADGDLDVANIHEDIGHDTPPDMDLVWRDGARLWGAKGPNVYWSRPLGPEEWDAVNSVNTIEDAGSTSISVLTLKPITAQALIGNRSLLFKDKGVFLYGYTYDPSPIYGDGSVTKILPDRGCINAKSVVSIGGAVFALDRDGIYAMRGIGGYAPLSEPIDTYIKRINWGQSAKFAAVVHGPFVYFSLALDTDTECYHYLALDWQAVLSGRGPRWWPMKTLHALRDLFQADLGSDGGATGLDYMPKAGAIDSRGSLLCFDEFLADCVPAYLSSTGTVTGFSATGGAGSNSRVTASGATWSANSQNVTRAMIRFQIGGQWSPAYTIAATNSATEIDLSSVVPSEWRPSNGIPFIIGQIDAEAETGLYDGQVPYTFKHMAELHIAYTASPIDWDMSVAFNIDDKGWQTMGVAVDTGIYARAASSADQTVSMGGGPEPAGGKGVVTLPISGQDFRRIKFRLKADSTNQPVEISRIDPALGVRGNG